MKKIWFILAVSMAFIFGMPTTQAQAKSYEITDYDVLVEIQEDGSAFFTEKITYDFDGAFNGIFYHLDTSDIESPTDVKVSMQAEGQQSAFPFALSSSEDPGTFTLENTDGFLNFTVYNPMEDEVQTVIYQYRLPEIITNYQDVAEFNRKVIGENWEDSLGNINIRIVLPHSVDEGQLRAWGHGERAGEVSIEDNQTVSLSLPRNPANQFVEARVIFPPSITSKNPHQVKEEKYDQIIDFEKKLAERRQRKNKTNLIWGILLGIAAPFFSLWAFIWLYRKQQKTNPHPMPDPGLVYELPADLSPAVMNSAVFNKFPGVTEITATILNLVRMEYLKIEELDPEEADSSARKKKQDYRLIQIKEADDALLKHEKRMIHWFIEVAGDGEKVTLSEIEQTGKDEKLAKEFYSEQEKWVSDVEEDAHPLKEAFQAHYANRALGYITLSVIGNVLVLFLTGLLAELTQITYWVLTLPVLGILLSILLIFYYVKHPPLTMEGDRAYKEWKGFRKMLEKTGDFPMQDVASLAGWDHYLVYAVALGLGDRVMKQMQITYPQEEWNDRAGGYMYYPNYWFVNSLNQSITSGITSSTPSSSSSSGTGGGFSGGSSGGSGGGSGGGAF